ncbi:UDP-GlcNAc:undecaprenyl-phosphate GlcNAc-1-phosphate transferase [Mesobacillus persicus]|uniref:UDP-GlcNAc:undecaprenyl-phosphate GlcNAc-1-phosphate transferase n=1 Tax=Mesobacillus persicus TaxID=930146 RepID=A0A1H8A7E2_9BACI|nr:MraY family glycosyltransferase [Mesobacillus persicus]SEM65718.1 UDP-GlcNAc:undecaprenyl-phosphate GlcNAc-1-phosphate transferase [Mesobacillus persicus]
MTSQLIIAFIVSFITVLACTPLVIKLAYKINATDKPNNRKVHSKIMPRLGGLAIFAGVLTGSLASGLYKENLTGITLGAVIIILIGILDDIYELSAKIKLLGQLAAAGIVVSTGLTIDFISIPFIGKFDLGMWAIPVTILWIVGITNAINLIDGLDGLAAGISAIGIATIAFMAFGAGKILILPLSVILLASTLGFLFYNFHPAKIFMGDTGALFLGYSIAILSLLGLYKSVTLFSFVVPILILGVPIFDTSYAIIRRVINKQPITAPDKSHLHHRILSLGLSHRNTVLVIYGLGILFSVCAVIFESTTLWGSLLLILGLLIFFQLIAEFIGLVNDHHKPFLKMFRKVTGKQ